MAIRWAPLNSSSIPGGRPRLFSMVTTVRSRAYTPYALRSFFETTGLRTEDRFILINNDDPELSQIIAPFKDLVTIVTNETPKGFATNANSMIDQALRSQRDRKSVV